MRIFQKSMNIPPSSLPLRGLRWLPMFSAAVLTATSALHAAEWSYSWPDASTPQGSVSPFLYGKSWAYCIEIDDNPATLASFAVDFFAHYQYTDAPPGVPGGTPRPFVGNAAIIVGSIGANSTNLNPDSIREIISKGWGVANHGYSHIGRTWGNPPEILTNEQIREELYWSQAILAYDYGNGRAPTHFIYPNGYTDYLKYFAEFGFFSGSLVGGSGGRDLSTEKLNLRLLSRAYLDEGRWAKSDAPLADFPEGGPKPGLLQIDFTHKTDPNPQSPNQQRWKQRMEIISSRFGKDGDDSLWSAPVERVVHYALASQKATLQVEAGRLTVKLPEDAPGTPLTIRLEGIPESTPLSPPEGGLLYRQGRTVWLTTPLLGQPGTATPQPAIHREFSGPVGLHTFDTPTLLAGVEIYHIGRLETETPVEVILTMADGSQEALTPKMLEAKWSNGRLLFSLLPNRPAALVKSIEVPEKPTLKTMDLWIIKEKGVVSSEPQK